MDLIRIDVVIDKMAVFSVGTSYVITKMSFFLQILRHGTIG